MWWTWLWSTRWLDAVQYWTDWSSVNRVQCIVLSSGVDCRFRDYLSQLHIVQHNAVQYMWLCLSRYSRWWYCTWEPAARCWDHRLQKPQQATCLVSFSVIWAVCCCVALLRIVCGLKLKPQIILPSFSEIDIFIMFLRIEYDLCMYAVVGTVT